jgi:two-component system, NarL family, sensor histidine kinase UhpB
MQDTPTPDRPVRDIAAVTLVVLATVILSARLNLNEHLYSLTRRFEQLQLDELPIDMLVLSIALVWLAWRRYRQASYELRARQRAEVRLERALADNRELGREILRVQEVERKHLARELHDELGQYLNAIKLDAVAIGEYDGTQSRLVIEAARAIIRSVDHVHSSVGGMIASLRPVGLDELGLVAAIEHGVDQWRARLPDTRFTLSIRGQFEDLGEGMNLILYRLIQESLTNVYKHANARQVEINLERMKVGANGSEELHLTVADDGCGMQSHTRSSRFGLNGMRERVEMEGGAFVLTSAPGQGLRLEAHLPVGGV